VNSGKNKCQVQRKQCDNCTITALTNHYCICTKWSRHGDLQNHWCT